MDSDFPSCCEQLFQNMVKVDKYVLIVYNICQLTICDSLCDLVPFVQFKK